MRSGDWIQTFTGIAFYPMDPRPEDIDIRDIAHALSMMCRFTGHIREFYSVATHSVLCSRIVPESDAMWGLLHDASEAYIADIARPVKPYLTNYKTVESKIMKAVAERFSLPWPMPESIHAADDVLVCTERRDLMGSGPEWGSWCDNVTLLDYPVECESPLVAKTRFLDRFLALQRRR